MEYVIITLLVLTLIVSLIVVSYLLGKKTKEQESTKAVNQVMSVAKKYDSMSFEELANKLKTVLLFILLFMGLSACATREYSPACIEWYTPVGTANLSTLSHLAVSDPTLQPAVKIILANEFKYEDLKD